ncbi:RNA-binding protein 42 [Paramicrosporidium saccamoebae]|uniref:RNA-binding protein 42 n=1 Tax=Paramicrosporidium saccamoebae TaxID=1246581 RepID=A0A2H9THW2_9FUNG|nr:RNA-binding protein 42 [Paramicrosporidium saccamoebae]
MEQRPSKQQPIGQLPIGQAPRKVQVSSTVVGAVPRASGTTIGSVPHTSGATTGSISRTSGATIGSIPQVSRTVIGSTGSTVVGSIPGSSTAKTNTLKRPAFIMTPSVKDPAKDLTKDTTTAATVCSAKPPTAPAHTLRAAAGEAFSRFGSLTKYRIIRDRKSNKSKGYGFVGFKEPQDFLAAIREMNVKLKKSNWTDRCIDSSNVKKSKHRVNFQQKGITPNIEKCKNIAHERSRRNKIDEGLIDESLETMRQERLSRKILVQRTAKKARTFAVQRVIKKLRAPELKKPPTTEQTETTKNREKIERLEGEMKRIKGVDLVEMAKLLFKHRIVQASEYLVSRTSEFIETSALEASTMALIEGQALTKTLDGIRQDMELFTRNLYHEHPEKESTLEKRAGEEEEEGNTTALEEETQLSVERPTKRSKPRTRDQERDRDREEREDKTQTKSGNRKGQRARRAEWERLYGQKAKHLHNAQHERRQTGRPKGAPGPHALEEKLHPSWEAQRRQRELQRTIASGKTMNQRIKFSED